MGNFGAKEREREKKQWPGKSVDVAMSLVCGKMQRKRERESQYVMITFNLQKPRSSNKCCS